ncbi:MAG: biopolymer transporter ExbD [Pseudomonadota bacterium]|nr:biopolymer transporter ExbD [Pseudomonadota bacterium]
MRFKNRKNDQDDLTIDLTPLLDVSFIILIFFILTTTFIEEKRLAIEKPKSNSVQTGQNTEIKIAIDKNNSLYFKNKLIDPGSLREKLKNELQNTPMSSLVIEADKTSELSIFVLVVDTAKSLDIQDITISTDRN